jgi:hypothetical protein
MDAEKTIGNIVLSTINRLKNFGVSTTDYMDMLEIATASYSEKMQGFNMPSVITIEIPINLANRVWNLPSDFVALGKVGYRDGKRIWTLTQDDTLDLTDYPEPCEAPTNNTAQTSGGVPSYAWGQYTRYGEGGGKNVNYYRVDWQRRRILFSESIPIGFGVVEYLSMGRNVNEDTFVPLAYVDAFRNLLMWKCAELSDNERLFSMSKDYERQYKETVWDANILAKSPTVSELLDSLYKSSGFTLR